MSKIQFTLLSLFIHLYLINNKLHTLFFNPFIPPKQKTESKCYACFAWETKHGKKKPQNLFLKIIMIKLFILYMVKVKGKRYSIRLYSPYRRCWSPFLGLSAKKCNGGLGASHPVLSHTLPVYLPQISPGTHLELCRLWLSLQNHATDPRPNLNNWIYWDSNPRPLRHRILNPAQQSTRPGRLL